MQSGSSNAPPERGRGAQGAGQLGRKPIPTSADKRIVCLLLTYHQITLMVLGVSSRALSSPRQQGATVAPYDAILDLLRSGSDLLQGVLERRGNIRFAERQNELAQDLEASRDRIQAAQEERSRIAEEARVRYRETAARYPLGTPGRLAALIGGAADPVILVSPIPAGCRMSDTAVAEGIYAILHDIEGFASYAELLSGAFVRSGEAVRSVEGKVGAREIAALEFSERPAVIIYFEPAPGGLAAFAFLSGMFRPVNGESGFALRIARYLDSATADGPGSPHSRANADFPLWHTLPLAGIPGLRPSEVVINSVSAFLVSVIATYWEIQGVRTGLFDDGTRVIGDALPTLPPPPPPSTPPPQSEVPRTDTMARLEQELSVLSQRGFVFEAEILDDGRLAVLMNGDSVRALCTFGADYPRSAPEIWVEGDAALQQFTFAEGAWTAGRTLVEVLEAIR